RRAPAAVEHLSRFRRRIALRDSLPVSLRIACEGGNTSRMRLEQALVADDPEDVATVLIDVAGGTIARFEEALPAALHGGFAAVVVVTSNWDALLEQTMLSASAVAPGSVEAAGGGVVKLHGQAVAWLSSSLRSAVAEAPF